MNPRLSLIAVLAAISMTAPGVAIACNPPNTFAEIRALSALGTPKIHSLQKGLRIRFANSEHANSRLLTDGWFGRFTAKLVHDLCQADLSGHEAGDPMKDAVTLAVAYADLPEDAPKIAELIETPEFRADFAAVVLNRDAPKTAGLIAVLDALGETAMDTRTIRQRLADLPRFAGARDLQDAILETIIHGASIVETGFFSPEARKALNSAVANARVHFLDPQGTQDLALQDLPFLAAFAERKFKDKDVMSKALVAEMDKTFRSNGRAAIEAAAEAVVKAAKKPETSDNAQTPGRLPDVDVREATHQKVFATIKNEEFREALLNAQFSHVAKGEQLKAEVVVVLSEVLDQQANDFIARTSGEIVGLIRTGYRLTDTGIDELTRFAAARPAPTSPAKPCNCDQVAMAATSEVATAKTSPTAAEKITLIEDIVRLKLSAEEAVERHGVNRAEIDLWLVAAAVGAEDARKAQQAANQVTDDRLRQAHEAYGEAMLELRTLGKAQSSNAITPID